MRIPSTSIKKKNYNYAPVEYLKKSMLGMAFDNTPEQDAQLDMLGETASRMIDNYTQQIFYQAQVRHEKKSSVIDHNGNVVVRTEYKPITAVHTLKLESIPAEYVDIGLNLLDIHYRQGTIVVYPLGYTTVSTALRRNNFVSDYFNTVISYDAGAPEVPSPIQRAAALLVRNMLMPGEVSAGISKDNSVNRGPIKKITSSRYSEEYDTSGGSTGGMTMSIKAEQDFLFTSDVRVLLQSYIKRGIL